AATGIQEVPGGGDWGYQEGESDKKWRKTCLGGFHRSPIDIRASDVDYAFLPRMHFVNYDNARPVNVTNNGNTVVIDGFKNWGDQQPHLKGGGLRHRYVLHQMHFHWAQKDHEGSEHKIGGLYYPSEVRDLEGIYFEMII
ncbi:hypothetical protein COOONC_09796, partial [Cooperia oncophora]